MISFPILYKKSSTGKISEWEIKVDGDCADKGIITIVHGYQDGKKQVDVKEITKGKNIGKENETTPFDQARSEAESKWKKQKDKGYVESLDNVDTVVYLPMLAHSYDKRGKDMKFPCIGQRKFDGVRCLAFVLGNNNVVLMSRKGKIFPHLEHLFEPILQLKKLCSGQIIFDGELYSDDLTFQRTVGLVKKETLAEEDTNDMRKICYRLYDSIFPDNPKVPFITRYQHLRGLLESVNCKSIKLTENVLIKNEDDIKKYHDFFVSEGYEGLILRNMDGVYSVNKRSKDLQKYKNFKDDEFEIVGFTEGEGRAKGTVIWKCKTKSGKEFSVRPRGTEGERKDWFENGNQYIGKMMTVRYFELTDDGIPRFPVGLIVRDYE